MALKAPLSKQEMLDVSGVGENKYSKYGEKFISAIRECTEEYPELIRNKVTEVDAPIIIKSQKKNFFLTSDEAENFKYAEYMYVSELLAEIKRICLRDDVKKIQYTNINEFLVSEELITIDKSEEQTEKKPTEKGLQQGIKLLDRISEKGNPYTILMYPENIQRMVVEHFVQK